MKKLKATHNGTCQACGRLQAHTPSGIARHGYTVSYGFFMGTCPASNHPPMELSHTFCDEIIESLIKTANTLEMITKKDIEKISYKAYKNFNYEDIYFTESEWEDYRNKSNRRLCSNSWSYSEMVKREVIKHHDNAKHHHNRAKFLSELKSERFGKELVKRI